PEAEVLKLIAQGQSNDDIAAELVVSTNTVKTHTSSLLAKPHARDRAALVITANQQGFVAVNTSR
ncbi:MAG: helix-turn-helix transcriptional regulator, partial [Propioniciclava sp.]